MRRTAAAEASLAAVRRDDAKRVILEICDEMPVAIRTGQPYQTRLDPPPADAAMAHSS